jgi:hypothetical protein
MKRYLVYVAVPSLGLAGGLAAGCGGKKAAPIVAATPSTLSPVTFNPPAGAVDIGTNITLTAPGLPADGHIFYTTDGTDPHGGSPVAYSGPIAIDASQTISAYAAAPGFADSAAASAAYTVESPGAAPALGIPMVTSAVTASGVAVAMGSSPSEASPSFTVTAQNAPLTATLTAAAESPTDTYFCVSLSSDTPTCSGAEPSGCGVGDTTVSGGTVSIGADGTILVAVACAPGTPILQSSTETITYHLEVTPLHFGAAVSACGESTSIGFDTTSSALAADLAAGGPTVGATICYGGAPYDCSDALPAGVACFTPSAGAYSQTVAVSTSTLYAVSCPPTGLAGQNGGTAVFQTETDVAAYSVAITLGASLSGNWSALSNQFISSSSGIRGGFSHDATDLYFEADGFTPGASTDVVIFLSDGTANHAMASAPTALGGMALPFAAELAIDYETSANTVRNLYANDGTSWSVVGATDSVYGSGFGATNLYGDLIATGGSSYQVAASNVLQALVPIGVLPSSVSGVVNVAGDIVSGIGGAVTTLAVWPIVDDSWGYVADTLSSCATPAGSIQ